MLYADEHFFKTVNVEYKLISVLEQDLRYCKWSLMAIFLIIFFYTTIFSIQKTNPVSAC